MERIGERLRRRREELGYTVEDVAEATRFRPEVIKALEEGRTGVFPAEAYLKAFLRAYATKLGLDPQEIIREQKSEEERVHEAIRGITVRPRRKSDPRRGLIWLGVVAAIAVAILTLYDRVWKGRSQPSGAGQPELGTPAATEAQGGFTDSAHTIPRKEVESIDASQGGSAGPGDAAHRIAADRASSPQASGQRSPPGQDSQRSPPDRETATEHQPQENPLASPIPGGEATAGLPQEAEPDWLSISVSGWSTYVTLLSGGRALIDTMLQPGYQDTFYSREPFVFDYISYKDAVSLLFNGRPVRLPPSGGRVVSNLKIPPD